MPWWVKALGALTAILFLAAFGLHALALGPPLNRSLERLAADLGAVGFLFGCFFLRAISRWMRIKFRARAWRTGRQEARSHYRKRHLRE
jgi:hypothetical protein